jgi:hypothetical protein
LLYGPYFRVAFSGNAGRENNGRTCILRENGLTNLYEVSHRLISEYGETLGCDAELIKESGECSPDPDVPSVQITFIEPRIKKAQARKRTTEFEMKHKISTFYFDTRFTNGEKAHGSVEEQWIRRTFLKLEYPIPAVTKLVYLKPEGIEWKEYPPIKVAYRQLKHRVLGIRPAVDVGDCRKIQQLLHGDFDPVYQAKLKVTFREFLTVNKEGLALHRKWVKANPAFGALQDELESGCASLDEKLRVLFDINYVFDRSPR